MSKELSGVELAILVIGGGLLLMTVGPTLVSTMAQGAVSWLVQWAVLVPKEQALVTIPGTQAGLDGARVSVGIGLVVMVVVWGRRLSRSRRQEP